MLMHTLRLRAFTLLAGIAVLTFSGWASADPPSRVARLGYTSGDVSFSPVGEYEWDRAVVNRPLSTGDRLWTDTGARAEIQVGGAMIRMNDATSVSVLNLDDQIAQLQLTQGTLNVRVRRLEPGQSFEVDTPNLAFTLREPGEYRIEVDPDGRATTIVVRKGRGDVYGEGAAYTVDSRQPYRFTGTNLSDYEYLDTPRLDEFDRWASNRDRSYDNSRSARYVSQDIVGYQDLDDNGTWRVDASYGNVWIPNRVAADWAPYRDGHWAWVAPWGWTWVDDAPWGFAVSHYGRWANMRGTWGWVPGPVRSRAYYAPALVVFVGGDNFQLTISSGNVGGFAWFPLAPREVYRPAYKVSRGYFENINQSNTVINNTVINNTYNTYNTTNVTNVKYINREVPGAVVAMPSNAFVQSQPVPKARQQVSRNMIDTATVVLAPPVAPTEKSVPGSAKQSDKPPPRVFERPVVARTEPPAAPARISSQLSAQPQPEAQPGKAVDEATPKEPKPAAPAPAPVVKVLAPTPESPRALAPPPAPAGAKSKNGRDTPQEAKPSAEPAAPVITKAPDEPKQVVAPAAVAPPEPAKPSPEQREKDQPRQAVTPPTAPQEAAKPQTNAPQAKVPARAEQLRTKAAKEEPSDNQKQREQVAKPPQVPQPSPAIKPVPQEEVQPGKVAPQAAPTDPASQQPGQKADSRDQRTKDKSGRTNDKKRDCVGPYCEE